jgi:hypothetical protein
MPALMYYNKLEIKKMKKRNLQTIALLGLTSGLLVSQDKANSAEYVNGQDISSTMADNRCKAKGGCGSAYHNCNMADHKCKGKSGCGSLLTAERDQPDEANSPYKSPGDFNDDDSSQESNEEMMQEKRARAMNGQQD